MARAHREGARVILDLSDVEAWDLFIYLGQHSMTSEVKTFSVFDRLYQVFEEEDIKDISPKYFMDRLTGNSITDGGLFSMKG